jgi:hypothetical protein
VVNKKQVIVVKNSSRKNVLSTVLEYLKTKKTHSYIFFQGKGP